MTPPSEQVLQQLAAGEAFLQVMLAERNGRLDEMQRELLTSTLTRVQRAAALLRTVPVDGVNTRDASAVSNHASNPQAAGTQPIAITVPHDADESWTA